MRVALPPFTYRVARLIAERCADTDQTEMSDYDAADLLGVAVKRYREGLLRLERLGALTMNRMPRGGAAHPTDKRSIRIVRNCPVWEWVSLQRDAAIAAAAAERYAADVRRAAAAAARAGEVTAEVPAESRATESRPAPERITDEWTAESLAATERFTDEDAVANGATVLPDDDIYERFTGEDALANGWEVR